MLASKKNKPLLKNVYNHRFIAIFIGIIHLQVTSKDKLSDQVTTSKFFCFLLLSLFDVKFDNLKNECTTETICNILTNGRKTQNPLGKGYT